MNLEDRLAEREKELACIYSLSLLAAGAPEEQAAAEGVARALCAAMERADLAQCTLNLFHRERNLTLRVHRPGGVGSSEKTGSVLARNFSPRETGGWEGNITLTYPDPGMSFLPQEESLLSSVAAVAASMLRTGQLLYELRTASDRLEAKNTALREVLLQMEEDRKRTQRSFQEKISLEILPLAEKAKDPDLDEERRKYYLEVLCSELQKDQIPLVATFVQETALSLREREIALQVRNGRTSKEIAAALGLSPATVERHRFNIRRKMGIQGKASNLASHLTSLNKSP